MSVPAVNYTFLYIITFAKGKSSGRDFRKKNVSSNSDMRASTSERNRDEIKGFIKKID